MILVLLLIASFVRGGTGITVEPVSAEVRARYGDYPVLSVTIDTAQYPTLQEITWYKGDLSNPISDDDTRFRVGGKGTQLNIALTQSSDYTNYICRVRGGEELCSGCTDCSSSCANCCASITLARTEESGATPSVSQTKSVWDVSDTITVYFGIESGAFSLDQVSWYKGTYPITTGGRYTITPVNTAQNKLTIDTASTSDNGEYAVVYKTFNSGVAGYGIVTFDIKVWGPPTIAVTPATARVTEGSDVTFTCVAKASTPLITYRWDKNSDEIVGQTSPLLVISNVVHENAASYKCTVSVTHSVTNQVYQSTALAYLVINDDTTMLIKTPFLLADVSSQTAMLSFDITSRVNEGFNSDMVTWYKDNVILEQGGSRSFGNTKKQLIITKPTASDEGHYRVLVQLTTITLEGSMYLAITSALPTVQFSASTYVGRSGEQLTFSIAVGGNPRPSIQQIEWYSNDVRLQQGDANVRFSDDFLTLYRSSLTIADGGVIKVAAETSAGRTEETAEVIIIEQDDIQITRSSDNQIIGKPLKLSVIFHMIPLPVLHNVQWTKSGEILTETDPRIEFYNSGQELLIRDVQLSDADTYRVSVNKVDGTTATTELQVSVKRVADALQFTTRPTDTTVFAGSTVTIPCDVSGTPSPSISFLFANNSQLQNEGRFYVTATSLVIYAAEVGDSGGYICRGSSGGDATPLSESFTITVNERIKITTTATQVEATMGGVAVFTVKVQPTNAKVEWTRSGVHFPESDGGHYDVSDSIVDDGGEAVKEVTLTISDVQTSDLGQYEVTASYSEGKYVKSAELELANAGVNVVSITGASGDQTVFRGQSARFSCSVSDDQSLITWTKNGVNVLELDSSMRSRYQLSTSRQELTITNTVSTDMGLYMCSVSGSGGSDEVSATLTVLTPIKITQYPTHRRLLLGTGSSYQLSVHITSGDPNSQIITWKLDGSPISGDTSVLSPAVPSSVGTQQYTVTALLTTWQGANNIQDEKDIYVTTYAAEDVQEAIIVQPPVDQIAILGSTVTFVCVAYGIPDPNVLWSRGSADMSASEYTNKFTSRGVESELVVSNVKVDSQGEYRCKADNLKGSIQTKSAYLEIISPPTVGLVDSVFYGVPGKEVVIAVDVTYQNVIEKSMCSWTRNGIQLTESGNIEFGNDGTSLRIISVESASAGNYRFTIETEAGSATTSTVLQIIDAYMYPTATIPQYHGTLVALVGSVYSLPCEVTGKPSPKVSWKRTIGDQTVEYTENGSDLPYSVEASGSLKILSVSHSDEGEWTCVAQSNPDSVLRTAEASLNLGVVEWLARPFVYPYHGHSTITVVSGDNLEVNIEVMYRYQIRAHNIIWSRLDFGKTNWTEAKELNTIDPGYDNVVSFARERRQLLVHGISKLFQGQYKASVATVSGKDETVIMVHVISRVPPNIKWLNTINNLYYTVNANSDRSGFVFDVEVTGEPFPKEITWYKRTGSGTFDGLHNGTVGNSYYMIGYYGNMYIKNPDKSDATFYKIQVIPENGAIDQMEESSIELIVKDYYLGFQTAPYVGGIRKEGVAVSMKCVATGVPDPESVTWFKGITRLTPTTSTLTIPSVTKADKGDYYCVAKNDYGTIYSPKVSLQVQYLDDNFLPITCLKEAGNSMQDCSTSGLTEGDVFMLKCNGPDGWPYPKTTWYFDDDPITDNADGLSPAVNQYGDLVFPFADPNQSGRYRCQVTNEKGTYTNYNPDYQVRIADSGNSDEIFRNPSWLVQPGDMTVAQHTPVTIACIVSSFPDTPTYRWTLNGSPFSVEMEQKLSFGGRLLTFDLIDENADGDYSCITNTREGDNPADFKLQVSTRPSFGNADIFMIGYIGNQTEIDLGTPAGHPVPSIIWTFNGEGVQLGNRIQLVDSRTLRIDPTQAGDEGVWQAIATNKAGSAQHAIYLKVEEDLEFVEHPSPGGAMFAAQYSTVRFPCKVTGTPPPIQYKWSRKDHGHEPFNGLPARAFEDEEHALVIPYAQTWDNGTYVCEVTNEYYKTIWGSVDLIVVEPPSIVIPPVDFKVNEFGDLSYLICRCNPQAVATNPCVVQFLKDGAPVSVGGDVTIIEVDKFSRQLNIASTQEEHLGRYECYGTNIFGSASAFAYITKTNKPYMITRPPERVTTSSKSSVELECNAIGYDPINYMWTFNDFPVKIDGSRMVLRDTGSLLIDGTTTADTGTFTCFASNPYGQSSVSTYLEVEGPPTKPPTPWVSSISRDISNSNSYSATIWVKSYDSIAVTKYIITRTEVDTATTTRVSTSNNPYTWSNLEMKSYTFSVVLQNKIEASRSSLESGTVDFRDYNSIPRTSITNVRAGDDNKSISWDPLGGASSYKIYQTKVSSNSARAALATVTTNSYTLPTDGVLLESYTEYDIQVVPITGGREGLYSEPLRIRTPPSTPATPSITGFMTTSDPTQLIVKFDSNWEPTTGLINEFNIFYKRESFDYSVSSSSTRKKRQSSGSVSAGSAAENVWLSELVPGERYSFRIEVVNNEDMTSERSDAAYTTTQTGLPGVPEITYCDGSGRDAVLVKWSAPSITNGIIRGYRVYYRDDKSFDQQAALVLAGTELRQDGFHYKNVTGLSENTMYLFAVSAYTDAGEGDKTFWTRAKTRQKSVPQIMAPPVVELVNWHTIHVTWVLTDDGLTGIDTFTIYLNSQITRRGVSSYVIPNRNDRSATISTLNDDTSYSLSIVATNNIGSSPKSATVQFRTWKKPLYLRTWFAGMMTGIFALLFIILFIFLFYYFIYKKKLMPSQQNKIKKKQAAYIARETSASNGGRDNRSLVLGNPVVVAADHSSEKYSTRNSRAGDHRPEYPPPTDMRLSELRTRHESENSRPSYHSNTQPRRYNDDGYSDSYNGSYRKDYYEPNNRYPEAKPYPDNRYSDDNRDRYSNDRHSDQYDQARPEYNPRSAYSDRSGFSDRGSNAGYPPDRGYDPRGPESYDPRGPDNYRNQYDDDRYSSSDNNNPGYNSNTMRSNNQYPDEGGLVIDNPSARFSQI